MSKLGIGERGTRLTSEKALGEQTVEILAPKIDKKAPVLVLPAGTHRFSFAFVIPNVSRSFFGLLLSSMLI